MRAPPWVTPEVPTIGPDEEVLHPPHPVYACAECTLPSQWPRPKLHTVCNLHEGFVQTPLRASLSLSAYLDAEVVPTCLPKQ